MHSTLTLAVASGRFARGKGTLQLRTDGGNSIIFWKRGKWKINWKDDTTSSWLTRQRCGFRVDFVHTPPLVDWCLRGSGSSFPEENLLHSLLTSLGSIPFLKCFFRVLGRRLLVGLRLYSLECDQEHPPIGLWTTKAVKVALLVTFQQWNCMGKRLSIAAGQ